MPKTAAPHFAPTAKRAIFLYLAGGTSQVELFDPKPKLIEHTGKPLPQSFLKNEKRLSFIDIKKSKLMGSRLGFRRYGRGGMEMSELLPNIVELQSGGWVLQRRAWFSGPKAGGFGHWHFACPPIWGSAVMRVLKLDHG